jgi:predicted Zn-dependent protease
LEYSSPEIPEGINYSKTHPLVEFAYLAGGVLGGLFLLLLALGFFADRLAHHIPYSVEQDIRLLVPEDNAATPELQTYLDGLARRIVAHQALPEDMVITVHYVDGDMVNAYATLGGHVVLFRGLLERLPNENALATVMAHEIAHIKHRHVIRSLGSALVVGVVVSVFSSSLGDTLIAGVIGDTGELTGLKFSRSHETEADTTALATLRQLYGHVHGGEDLFEALQEEDGTAYVPEFLSTHPDIERRIARIEDETAGATPALTALPGEFESWLAGVDED